MQRILSVETSRTCSGSSEFVSKRLCFSCTLTVAFLALIGGFLLGKHTTEMVFQRRHVPEIREIAELSISLRNINNLTTNLQPGFADFDGLQRKLACANFDNVTVPREEVLKSSLSIETSKTLQLHLGVLASCFDSIGEFLKISVG